MGQPANKTTAAQVHVQGSDTATSIQTGALSQPPAPPKQTAGALPQPPAAAVPHPVATSTTPTMTDQGGDWSPTALGAEDEEKGDEDEVIPTAPVPLPPTNKPPQESLPKD